MEGNRPTADNSSSYPSHSSSIQIRPELHNIDPSCTKNKGQLRDKPLRPVPTSTGYQPFFCPRENKTMMMEEQTMSCEQRANQHLVPAQSIGTRLIWLKLKRGERPCKTANHLETAHLQPVNSACHFLAKKSHARTRHIRKHWRNQESKEIIASNY